VSLRRRALNQWLRRVEKPKMRRAKSAEALRRNLELQARLFFHPPRGTRFAWRALEAGSVTAPMLEVRPKRAQEDRVIFFIHGGGFVFGSPRTHRAMVAQLAHRLEARAVLPRYPLGPEAQYPAAQDAIRAAWDGLVQSGVSPQNIVVGGDSAGGALAFLLLSDLCRDGVGLPGAVFAFSPLTDMTHSLDSFRTNADAEAVLPAERALEMGQMYLGDHPSADPEISPLRRTYPAAPPVWLTVGDTEILRDDSRALAQALRDQAG